jgi:hypothetical protein
MISGSVLMGSVASMIGNVRITPCQALPADALPSPLHVDEQNPGRGKYQQPPSRSALRYAFGNR